MTVQEIVARYYDAWHAVEAGDRTHEAELVGQRHVAEIAGAMLCRWRP